MTTKYDWSKIPKEVLWVATDSYTGTAQGYVTKPKPNFDRWVTGSTKYWLHLPGCTDKHWLDSLEERPITKDNKQ